MFGKYVAIIHVEMTLKGCLDKYKKTHKEEYNKQSSTIIGCSHYFQNISIRRAYSKSVTLCCKIIPQDEDDKKYG